MQFGQKDRRRPERSVRFIQTERRSPGRRMHPGQKSRSGPGRKTGKRRQEQNSTGILQWIMYCMFRILVRSITVSIFRTVMTEAGPTVFILHFPVTRDFISRGRGKISGRRTLPLQLWITMMR